MQNFTDSIGNSYALTYDSNNRLVLVTEPAGRWLKITYEDITLNQQQFTLFYAQLGAPPPGLNIQFVNTPGAFRYLRYYSTDEGGVEGYSNIAEIMFFDTNGNYISGTPFGSTPAYNNSSSTFDKAFDLNFGTYFEYASPHFGFTGIDLGPGNATQVGAIAFYPRPGYEWAMDGTNTEGLPTGSRFEGSNVAPVTETVIAQVQAGYGMGGSQVITRTAQYHYTPLADTVLNSNWLDLTSVTYGDGTQATYTYQLLYSGQHPLLATADDTRNEGNATQIAYEFWQGPAHIEGNIYAEHDLASNQILAKFEGQGPEDNAYCGRKITYANGGAKTLLFTADHNVLTYADELGNTTSYAYTPGNGFLQVQVDPLNRYTVWIRDAQGRVLNTYFADG